MIVGLHDILYCVTFVYCCFYRVSGTLIPLRTFLKCITFIVIQNLLRNSSYCLWGIRCSSLLRTLSTQLPHILSYIELPLLRLLIITDLCHICFISKIITSLKISLVATINPIVIGMLQRSLFQILLALTC